MNLPVSRHAAQPALNPRRRRPAAFARAAVSVLLAGLIPAAAVLAADTPEPAPAVAPAPIDRLAAGRAAIPAQDWKKAVTELTVLVREQPGLADGHNLLAFAFRKQATSNLPRAFEHYRIALKLDPNHKGAHEYIGEAYLMDKQPAKAEEHLARLKTICGGTACEEYDNLGKAITGYKAANK